MLVKVLQPKNILWAFNKFVPVKLDRSKLVNSCVSENIASIDSVADVSKSLKSNSFKALHPLNIPSIFFTYLEVNFDKFILVNLLSPINISLISSASFGLKVDKSKDSRYHISANI